jgi:hypothetical protein
MAFILAGFIVFILSLIVSLFYIMKYPKISIPVLSCIIIVCCLCVKFYLIPNRQLSKIPSELNATKILYQNEDYSGAGIIVYELPKETRLRIEAEGLDYLNSASNKNNKPGNDDGIFENWRFTPIPISDPWTGPIMDGVPEYKTDIPQISNFLSRYGMGVNVEHEIESKINGIIKSSGSYFSYQNVRLIIISPRENIIVYAYSR